MSPTTRWHARALEANLDLEEDDIPVIGVPFDLSRRVIFVMQTGLNDAGHPQSQGGSHEEKVVDSLVSELQGWRRGNC